MQWPVPFGSRASTGAKVLAISSASAIAHQCNCQRREKGTLRLSIIVSTPKRTLGSTPWICRLPFENCYFRRISMRVLSLSQMNLGKEGVLCRKTRRRIVCPCESGLRNFATDYTKRQSILNGVPENCCLALVGSLSAQQSV